MAERKALSSAAGKAALAVFFLALGLGCYAIYRLLLVANY